jgi:hypothetical protein
VRVPRGPAESETPGTHRNFTRENREARSLSGVESCGPVGESDEP